MQETVSASELWTDIVAKSFDSRTGTSDGSVNYYRLLRSDLDLLAAILAEAPLEGTSSTAVELELPLPDGSMQRFHIELSPIMAPSLSERFPQVKTYRGRGIDDPSATARLDITPKGFHGVITTAAGMVYIDPGESVDRYRSYYRQDFLDARHDSGESATLSCAVQGEHEHQSVSPTGDINKARSGPQIRIYRLAVSATGEYTQFHGGTVSDGMAAIATAINRINEVYERDLAIRFELVAGNQNIVFTDALSDPFSNSNENLMFKQNQSTIDSVIGTANYDVGHIFATDGGGLAQVEAACRSASKAKGVSGFLSPSGDPFYIDLVAHELGHQLGANHSFNGTTDSCSGINRDPATAFEPGSGSTIMAYAGICGSENVTSFSDAIFHSGSIEEILNYTGNGVGSSCGQTALTGNNAPTVNAGSDASIPHSTPFTLTGSATDPDTGQSRTYQWDQMDAGSATDASTYGTDLGDNALFRSLLPSNDPARTFPRLSTVLAGTVDKAETLPTSSRTLNFRLTARDGAGGVGEDDVQLQVSSLAGPFALLQPNTSVTLDNTNPQVVTWDVAGTDNPPVNCSIVNLLLSTNGGNDFNTVLASETPNDGAESINLPSTNTRSARIKVECADNLFFDVSDTNFAISRSGIVLTSGRLFVSSDNLTIEEGDSATFSIVLTLKPTSNVQIILESSDLSALSLDQTALVFTSANWDTAQVVTLTAATDSDGLDSAAVVTVRVDDAASDDNFDDIQDKQIAVTITEPRPLIFAPSSGGGGSVGIFMLLTLGIYGFLSAGSIRFSGRR